MSEIKHFTYEEIQELVKMPMPWRVRSLITFQYASGARVGELLEYTHRRTSEITKGILKSNIQVNKEEGVIEWAMPNFKVKNEAKKTKFPFVLKQEKLFWNIIMIWLNGSKKHGVEPCGEQVFEFKQVRARQLIKKEIVNYARKTGKWHFKDYASHALRRSRGTHLVEKFGYNAYEVMEALGHSKLQSGISYVAIVNRKKKMKERLLEMNKEKSGVE